MTLSPIVPVPALGEHRDPRGLGGLLALKDRAEIPLPLRAVKVRAEIVGTLARTVVEQRFHNPLTTPLDVVHLYPTPPDGAIVAMELACGDLVARAECRPREEAKAAFEAAARAGHTAGLLTRERDDIHTLRVSRLPPGEEVRVRTEIVERLDVRDGLACFRFPTTLPPRYVPGTPVGHQGPGVVPDTELVPDASHLQPPLRLEGGVPLDLEVLVRGAPRRVVSSLHAVSLVLDEGVRVAPSARATCDRDFVLGISFAPAAAFGVSAWTDGDYTLVEVDPPAAELPPQLPRDAVFVVDVSGSMAGSKLAAAKAALQGALHGLLPGDRFRLLAFESRLHPMSRDFLPYDEANLRAGDAWIAGLSDLGGTEMLPALQAAFEGVSPAGRLRTVLFITDGQSADEDRLVAAVANRRGGARLFTLGIDTAVNASLLQRLARVGGGACDLCTPEDDIEAVVARLEARFGSPVAEEVVVEGAGLTPSGAQGTLYLGRPHGTLAAGAPARVTVRYRTPRGPQEVHADVVRIPTPLGALWAREQVARLEDRLALRPFEEEAIRPEIRRIALAAGIASRETALVAVETRRVVAGEPVVVVQPHEAPAGWELAEAGARGGPPRAGAPGGSVGGGGPLRMSMSPARPVSAPPPSAKLAEAAASMDRAQADADADESAVHPPPAAAPLGRVSQALRSLFRREVSGSPPDADDVDTMEVRRAGAPSPAKRTKAAATPPAPSAPRAASAPPQSPPDPAATLAATQSADGSWGGDVLRTAAALILLVRAGHTRRAGLRQRAVRKAAAWLEQHADPRAVVALGCLAAAESGAAEPAGVAELVEEARRAGRLPG